MNNDNKENDWGLALSQQENERQVAADAETQQYGERVMSDFDNLVVQGNQRKAEARRMKDATLSAMILQARKNKGYVPVEVLEAASANMGFPVAGGNFDKDGNFFLYTMQQGQNGARRMAPVAIATPEMQFQTLGRAKMGVDYRREIYGNLAKRFTPEQLAMRGFQNPDGQHVTGSVTDKGGVFSRALADPERRGGSAFSADGKGGFSRVQWDGDGNRIEENGGTRADEKGQWKQISVGPDTSEEPEQMYDENGNPVYTAPSRQVRRYENTKTGEVVSVRDGERPPWEAPASDRMAIEQMKQENMNGRQASKDSTKLRIADKNNATKIKVTGMQQDGQTQRNAEDNATKREINAEREKGRQSRAVMRDKVQWEKLANEKAKIDNDFAVKMKRADTYGKRVDLIESKIDRDYEIALKKADTADRKLELEERFKTMKNDIEEGRLDLEWLKVENAFDLGEAKNAETERHNKAGEGQKAAELEERKRQFNEREKRLSGKMSSDGGTGKAVSYNDLKAGQSFFATGKDGKRHKYRKTENGYELID